MKTSAQLRPGVTVFLPSAAGGGAERSMITIANGLAARGVTVTLALGTAAGPCLAAVNTAVRILDLGTPRMPLALLPLARHLRKARPRALLSAMSHANIVAALAHRLSACSARLVLSERVHSSSLFTEFPGLPTRIMRTLLRVTYPWAERIVAVSNGVAEDLGRHVPKARDRIVTIYNPVVDSRLRELAGAAPGHPWLPPVSVPVVLAAGRLIHQKDFATLIRAFAHLRRQRPLRLIVLGEGELRGTLEQLSQQLGVASDISFAGFASNPIAAMRAADVFVLSSRFEGLPGVLIQAMACGTRVVSTDCPSGPSEILEGGRWGALVPVGNPTAMADAIGRTLDDKHPPDVRARAAAFGEEAAISRYLEVLGINSGCSGDG